MIIKQHRIYRRDLRNNPNLIYVFGDNAQREGMGGQAGQMRGESNAVGVATLWGPSGVESNYFSEARTKDQNALIDSDMSDLFVYASQGRTIVMPDEGLGTGLAEMQERAPTSFAYLQSKLKQLGYK